LSGTKSVGWNIEALADLPCWYPSGPRRTSRRYTASRDAWASRRQGTDGFVFLMSPKISKCRPLSTAGRRPLLHGQLEVFRHRRCGNLALDFTSPSTTSTGVNITPNSHSA